jgi:8-oxo-dGTP pyrophosphatase MutT (NUDIX family)
MGRNLQRMENIRCDDYLLRLIKENMSGFTLLPQDRGGLRRAAVAITIVDIDHDPALYDIPYQNSWKQNAALILTRRASRLKRHSGQWALPGGKMEDGETPAETALRELGEEVGLDLDPDRVIGRLDDYITHSGFVISPVVVWGGTGHALIANPEEVASIHRIPLAEFLRKDAPIFEDMPGSDNPVLLMPVGRGSIASPTAAMLFQFREVAIFGQCTRVSHYEQPLFARK